MTHPLIWTDSAALGAVAASFAVILTVQLLTIGRGTPQSADDFEDDNHSGRIHTTVSVAGVSAAWIVSRVNVLVLPSRPLVVVAGVAMMWAGFVLRAWARWTLGRFYDPVVTVRHDHAIIDTGPYAAIRHPIYAGLILTYAGLGVALGTALAVVLAALPTIGGLAYRIRIEERVLTATLGQTYIDYAKGHKRLVPWFW